MRGFTKGAVVALLLWVVPFAVATMVLSSTPGEAAEPVNLTEPHIAGQMLIVGSPRGHTVLKEWQQVNVFLVAVPDVAVAVTSARAQGFAAQPNYVHRLLDTPNDEYFAQQWNMPLIDAPEAWDITLGSAANILAIADSGCSVHPDVSPRVVECIYFDTPGGLPDGYGHSTHVTSIAAGVTNNAIGVAGVDRATRVVQYKVCTDDGGCPDSWLLDGLLQIANNPDVIGLNASWGCACLLPALHPGFDAVLNAGKFFIAAAGNNACYWTTCGIFEPATYPGVLSVAATNSADAPASFTNRGDVAAPGVGIYAACTSGLPMCGTTNGYASKNGTSMASPHVAGVAALVKAAHPTKSAQQVVDCITGGLDPLPAQYADLAAGRVNALKAVQCSGTPSPTPTATATSTPTTTVTATATPTPRPFCWPPKAKRCR